MRAVLVMSLFCGVVGSALADDVGKGEKVPHDVYTRPYFEKNNSGLQGDASYLVLSTQQQFEAIFGFGFVMKMNPPLLPKDNFDKRIVVAVIKRGNAITNYKVESVTNQGGVVTVKYATEMQGGGGTAKFASPLIIAIDKGKYKTVEFWENGKKAGTAEVKESK